jgi:outer membrane murein-binding lipoprotein Lpp
MTLRILCSLFLAGGLLAGCATKPKPESSSSSVAATESAVPAGTPAVAATPASAAKPAAKRAWFAYLSPATWIRMVIPKKAQPPVAEPPRLIGTIKMVNKEDKFVLIDAMSYGGAQPGDALVCIVNQRESANLRASELRNPPFLIADITSGNPSPGDKVYKQ